jgi:hypothetical protein
MQQRGYVRFAARRAAADRSLQQRRSAEWFCARLGCDAPGRVAVYAAWARATGAGLAAR